MWKEEEWNVRNEMQEQRISSDESNDSTQYKIG
jgi:hypothetical protein